MNSTDYSESEPRELLRLDWASKSLLRQKENFCILEGLLSLLLVEKVSIVDFLESESNAESRDDKTNRVDIKARNSKGEIILVEIQFSRQHYFLQRMLYATSKTIVEHMSKGDPYSKVVKVYSVNILYFILGVGSDYLYRGRTDFIGLNTNDRLMIKPKDKEAIQNMEAYKVYPEYFLLRVSSYNGEPRNELEEWMRYLKDGIIAPDTAAPGLKEAYERLLYEALSKKDRKAYDDYIDELRYQQAVSEAARDQVLEQMERKARKKARKEGIQKGLKEGRELGIEIGREEGLKEGREEGLKEGREEGLKTGREEGLKTGREEGLKTGREEGLKTGREEGLKTGREEGLKEGLEQGVERGREEERLAIARQMKAMGLAEDFIAEATGLEGF